MKELVENKPLSMQYNGSMHFASMSDVMILRYWQIISTSSDIVEPEYKYEIVAVCGVSWISVSQLTNLS